MKNTASTATEAYELLTTEFQSMFVNVVDALGTEWEMEYNDEANGHWESEYLSYTELGRGWGRALNDLVYPITIKPL